MKLLTSVVLITTIGVTTLKAQDSKPVPNNLVPNGSFEQVDKKVKGPGDIALATGWFSPTMQKGDLYTSDAKNGYATPTNVQGYEKAFDGKNYAGVRFYGYRGRLNRSYIEVKLNEPLEEGQTYCVRFYFSLSDASKYACNNISAFLSKDKVEAKNNNPLKNKPQIQLTVNPILKKQFYWTPVCNTFKAEGGEQYLVIGNFATDADTKSLRLRRPRSWHQPQTQDSYYFIDQVSVVSISDKSKCNCDISPDGVKYTTVDETFKSDPNAKPVVPIEETKITYTKYSYKIEPNQTAKLNELATQLLDSTHKTVKIEVIGCRSAAESSAPTMSKLRANGVSKYLQSKGVKESRIIVKELKDLPKMAKTYAGAQVVIKPMP